MTGIQAIEKFIKVSVKLRTIDVSQLETLLDNLSDQQISDWGRVFDAGRSYSEAEQTNIPYWRTKERQDNYLYVNLKNAYSSKLKDDSGKYIFDRQDYQIWLLDRVKNVIEQEISIKQNETILDKVNKISWGCAFLGLACIGFASIFKFDWIGMIGIVLFAASFLNFVIIKRIYRSRQK